MARPLLPDQLWERIEPLLPLDWLPDGFVLTNNSGVHVQKTREAAMMALLMLNARLPAIVTNQRESRWDQIFTPRIAGKRPALATPARRIGPWPAPGSLRKSGTWSSSP